MINKFTAPRQSTQLNVFDNEQLMELTPDELSELHGGGWLTVARGIAIGIGTEIIIAGAKAAWASSTSYADTVGTFDYPGA